MIILVSACFITLRNGSQRLVVNEFTFHRSYDRKHSDARRWRCSARLKGCKVFAILNGNEDSIVRLSGTHNHEPPKIRRPSEADPGTR
ncbi:uncharacterized protein pre-mod(mdg4)-H [Epargyreus clarus]|uniref:uncharacterized protein pre-mod(mdg4)-H n=1 Tax=Epargyreus clarus TaxID=520877 RepID=UPI003C2D2168